MPRDIIGTHRKYTPKKMVNHEATPDSPPIQYFGVQLGFLIGKTRNAVTMVIPSIGWGLGPLSHPIAMVKDIHFPYLVL